MKTRTFNQVHPDAYGVKFANKPGGVDNSRFGWFSKTKNHVPRHFSFFSSNSKHHNNSNPHFNFSRPVKPNTALRTALFRVLPLRDFQLRKIVQSGSTLKIMIEQKNRKELPFAAISAAVRSVGAGKMRLIIERALPPSYNSNPWRKSSVREVRHSFTQHPQHRIQRQHGRSRANWHSSQAHFNWHNEGAAHRNKQRNGGIDWSVYESNCNRQRHIFQRKFLQRRKIRGRQPGMRTPGVIYALFRRSDQKVVYVGQTYNSTMKRVHSHWYAAKKQAKIVPYFVLMSFIKSCYGNIGKWRST